MCGDMMIKCVCLLNDFFIFNNYLHFLISITLNIKNILFITIFI